MKITTIAICISAILFSFNANGIENKEYAINASPNQITAINQIVFNLENQKSPILVGTDIVEHKLLNQSPLNNRDINIFTKFCILLGISMVYWIYWLKC